MPKSSSAMRTPERFEAPQDRHRAGEVVDQNAFRDLELEPPGVQSGLDQSLVDEPHDVVVAKLHRRQIDGNLQLVRPGRGFAARGTQDPFTHRDDQPVLFREWNENSGCDQAAARMVPADQRFETHDLAVDPRQRLIIEPQFVVGDGGLQIVLQFASIAQLRRHVGLEEPDRIAPFGLGAVKRDVRVGEKRRRVGPVGRTGRDADAQSDAQLSSGDLDVAAQRGPAVAEPAAPTAAACASPTVITMNSSPPTRARKAPSATACRRRATSRSSASPTRWP